MVWNGCTTCMTVCGCINNPMHKSEGPNGAFYRDDFNDSPWSCSMGTTEENGIWMNTSDQAGTVMAVLVWILLGECNAPAHMTTTARWCVDGVLLSLPPSPLSLMFVYTPALFCSFWSPSLFRGYDDVVGAHGWFAGLFVHDILHLLCSGLGKPRQDNPERSRVGSRQRRPDRGPPASSQTQHVQPMPNLQTTLFSPLPHLQPVHIPYGPPLPLDEQLHRIG